jgi:hypothetical protein
MTAAYQIAAVLQVNRINRAAWHLRPAGAAAGRL